MANKCAACDELRDHAPDFITNGVTTDVYNSLLENNGLNPDETSTNCADLNDVNDCLIERMAEEVSSYRDCDWKLFMKNFIPNVYQTLKAMIASECGLWENTGDSCENIGTLLGMLSTTPQAHEMTTNENIVAWGPDGYGAFYLNSDIKSFNGCGSTTKVENVSSTYNGTGLFLKTQVQSGDILASINKSAIVPTYMTNAYWKNLAASGEPFFQLIAANGCIIQVRTIGRTHSASDTVMTIQVYSVNGSYTVGTSGTSFLRTRPTVRRSIV